MHGRTDVPDPLDSDMVLRISLMADKYDYISSLTYAIKSWVVVDGLTDARNHWKLMAAAYFFGDELAFGRHTSKLITEFEKGYQELVKLGGFSGSDMLLRVCSKCLKVYQYRFIY
jgi:hypothetical protein